MLPPLAQEWGVGFVRWPSCALVVTKFATQCV